MNAEVENTINGEHWGYSTLSSFVLIYYLQKNKTLMLVVSVSMSVLGGKKYKIDIKKLWLQQFYYFKLIRIALILKIRFQIEYFHKNLRKKYYTSWILQVEGTQ